MLPTNLGCQVPFIAAEGLAPGARAKAPPSACQAAVCSSLPSDATAEQKEAGGGQTQKSREQGKGAARKQKTGDNGQHVQSGGHVHRTFKSNRRDTAGLRAEQRAVEGSSEELQSQEVAPAEQTRGAIRPRVSGMLHFIYLCTALKYSVTVWLGEHAILGQAFLR
jgi:hypothetical protein